MLILLPVFALIAGKVINETLVPGSYEWMGLIRISSELFERSGFWCVALAIWAVGISNSMDGISWSKLLNRRDFALTWGGTSILLASISLLVEFTRIAGTLADLTALILLLSGLISSDLCRDHNRLQGLKAASRSLFVGIAILAGYTAVGYFHTMIKGALFVLHAPEDAQLWAIDTLFLGKEYYQNLKTWRLANPQSVRWLDIIYIGLLQQICWSALFFHGSRDVFNARRYVLAMFLIYTIGPLVYFVAPSMGPIFYSPESFSDLRFVAHDTWHLSKFLFSNTNATIAGTAHEIAPFGYIAALPSLHVGIALIMLLAMRRSRLAVLFNALVLTFTIAATNILGWHYLVDAVAGIILGLLTWRLASVRYTRLRTKLGVA